MISARPRWRAANRASYPLQEPGPARAWAAFWDGHVDLDALAWEVTDLLAELDEREARVAGVTVDDVLLSLPGVGPTVAPTIRAFLGDGSRFPTAKHATSFVGVARRTGRRAPSCSRRG